MDVFAVGFMLSVCWVHVQFMFSGIASPCMGMLSTVDRTPPLRGTLSQQPRLSLPFTLRSLHGLLTFSGNSASCFMVWCSGIQSGGLCEEGRREDAKF